MISILIGLSFAQDDGALARLQAQKTFRARLVDQVQSVVGLFEDAEQRLGLTTVAEGFVRGVQTQRVSETAGLIEKIRSLSDEAAVKLKDQIREVYKKAGSRVGLRSLRNAERRITSVQGQLIEVTQEVSKLDTTSHLEKVIAEGGGSVSSVFRGVLAELTRSGGGMFDFLYPFHLLDGLWSDSNRLWYEKVLLSPLALIGDLILLPFQGIVWFVVWIDVGL